MSEVTETLYENDSIRVERIFSHGVASGKNAWYNNHCDEWVHVVKGHAVLEFENQTKQALQAGDSFYIHARLKHRVDATSLDCEWLCVYLKTNTH